MAVRESYSIKSDRNRRSAPTIVKVSVFLSFWLFIGFALGTVTLLYPVRWWATFCRERGYSEGFESGGVVTLILLLVAVSASLAIWAATVWVRTPSTIVRLVLPVAALGLAGMAYSFWINPESMKANMADDVQATDQFTFGPYPDESKLRQLKDEGYSAVISLLHPAVVPFEPQLIKREGLDAQSAGIELIHLPMLPWVSDNTESLDRLRELASSGEGRYYIHCYLGADRVNVARRIIEQEAGISSGPGPVSARSLARQPKFERGEIYRLEDDLYLIPYPTDEEFLGFILAGQVKHVVSLLDSQDRSERKRLDHEKTLAANYGLELHHVDVGPSRYDPHEVLRGVELAKSLERPVAIHAFFTYPKYKSALAEAIVQAALTGRPPIPPAFFEKPIQNGRVEVVAPHVAVGPRPEELEWESVLVAKGIRTVFSAGASNSTEEASRREATAAGLEWKSSENVQLILDSFDVEGGPFYVYGPLASEVKQQAASRYGPALPEATRNGS